MDGLIKGIAYAVGAAVTAGIAYSVGANVGATKRLQEQYKADGVGDVGYIDAMKDVGAIVMVAREVNKKLGG